jgi:STE24 endopeptidase
MQLAILIAVICALAHGDALQTPAGGALWRTALTLAGALVAPLAATLGSVRLARDLFGREDGPSPAVRENGAARLQTLAIVLWLVGVAATMYLVEWPRVVRSDWHLGGWPLVDEILVLLPVVLPLLFIWAAFYRLQWAMQRAIAARIGVPAGRPKLAQYLWLNARNHLALVLMPALAVVAFQETLKLAWPEADASGRAWWIYGPLLIALLVATPLAVRHLWRTSPLAAGPLRDELLAICRREGAGVRDILIWNTGGQMPNAAVAGLVRGLRYVLLTDALVARLSPVEIAAVLRHELGHIRGRHLPLRILVLALPIVAWLAVTSAFPALAENAAAALAWTGMSPALQMSLLFPAAIAVHAIFVVGAYSRWLEHEADLATCLTPAGVIDPAAAADFASALRKVVGPSRESRLAQWLHPSVPRRLDFLRQAADDPAIALRFRRRLQLVAWAIVATYLTLALFFFV